MSYSRLLAAVAVIGACVASSGSATAADRLVGVCSADGLNLCEADPATGVATPITTDGPARGYRSPAVSTDGGVLGYIADVPGDLVDERPFRGGPDPASATVVDDRVRPDDLTVSPNGQGVAFRTTMFRSGLLRSILRIYSPDYAGASHERTVPIHVPGWLGREALTSSDGGATICVFRQMLDPCARSVAMLAGADLFQPVGSPDATRLAVGVAVGTSDARTTRIVLFDPGTAARIRDLTQGPADTSPTWSPDGTKVAFQRGPDTWVVHADASTAPRLLVAGLQSPSWGRDPTADVTAPQTTISAGPSGPTSDDTPTFQFSADEPGASFECRVDAAAFSACSSPHTTSPLSNGAHSFAVRARDAAQNIDPTPASRTFTVMTSPPPPSENPVPACLRLGPVRIPLNLPPAIVRILRDLGLIVTDGSCR